jgi:LmbE family N-acetylglucosaminyl deacetylase
MENEFIPKSAMSIHAHPDDQDFTVSGTLAKWSRAGCKIVSVIVTSGDAGSNDPSKSAAYKTDLGQLREAEQQAANKVLGIGQTVFLRYPDGELVPSIELRRELTRLIRRHKPEVVVTGDPSARFYGNEYVNHPDHRAASEAAIYAVFPSAGSRMIFADLLDEGLPPHEVKRLYIHGNDNPDTWIDITGTIEIKIDALKKHVSQGETQESEQMLRDWAAEEGKPKTMRHAEAFRVMILQGEEDLPGE